MLKNMEPARWHSKLSDCLQHRLSDIMTIRVLVWVLAGSLPIQVPAKVPEKAGGRPDSLGPCHQECSCWRLALARPGPGCCCRHLGSQSEGERTVFPFSVLLFQINRSYKIKEKETEIRDHFFFLVCENLDTEKLKDLTVIIYLTLR